MAASNKRKTAGSPVPRQRRFGDKIAVYHCNEEKKQAKKKISKVPVAEEKMKLSGRKRRIPSPSQKENHYAVAIVPKTTLNSLSNVDDRSARVESPVNKLLQLPEVRMVGRLMALRCQPRLTDERVETEVFVKRHEKLEKEEKQILRSGKKIQVEEPIIFIDFRERSRPQMEMKSERTEQNMTVDNIYIT
uniref:TPX2 C-terminal domain-containing protein n=1 Tax=Angiostrongylus cantonensis TaxID=6313 RepID=A0A0K0DGW8_ANGCA